MHTLLLPVGLDSERIKIVDLNSRCLLLLQTRSQAAREAQMRTPPPTEQVKYRFIF